MAQNLWVNWQCPHCGFKNSSYLELSSSAGYMSPIAIYCDIDTGGCDKLVVIKPKVTVEVETFRLVQDAYAPVDDPDPVLADFQHRKAQAQAYMAAERGE